MTSNPYTQILADITDTLKADPTLAQAQITILAQDDKDLTYEIDKLTSQATGSLIVVEFKSAEVSSNAATISGQIVATESPTINRTRANYLTALAMAAAIQDTLDSTPYHIIALTQANNQDYISVSLDFTVIATINPTQTNQGV